MSKIELVNLYVFKELTNVNVKQSEVVAELISAAINHTVGNIDDTSLVTKWLRNGCQVKVKYLTSPMFRQLINIFNYTDVDCSYFEIEGAGVLVIGPIASNDIYKYVGGMYANAVVN